MESNQCNSPSYLESWLATTNGWFDPTELHDDQDQVLTRSFPSPSTALTYSTCLYSFASRGGTRGQKRKGSMNSDTASNVSGETTRTSTGSTSAASFANRPILHPIPPSTRQRSPSPTRKVLSQLKLATPSLRVCQPDVRLEQPPMVGRLRSMLIRKMSANVIPHCFKVVFFLPMPVHS